jgi:hypothetical protein
LFAHDGCGDSIQQKPIVPSAFFDGGTAIELLAVGLFGI